MKAIPLSKLVCGNCKLRDEKGVCNIDYRKELEGTPACSKIHKNFIDNGLKREE